MPKQPRLIDADKLLEWLDKQIDNAYSQDINAQDAYMITKWAAEEGKFGPTPPVQPDTPKLGDTVRHKAYGIGIVIDADDHIATVNFNGLLEIPFLHELEVIK